MPPTGFSSHLPDKPANPTRLRGCPAAQPPADGPLPCPLSRNAKHHESPGTEAENPGRAAGFCRRAADRERLVAAQAGHDVRDPEAARRKRRADLRRRRARSLVGRVRLPALAGSQLPARPRRHLCQPEPGAPLWPAHRRYGRRPDPLAARRRALFRAAQGQQHQFRGARPAAPPDQFRQSDAALSRREDPARTRRPDQEGSDDPRHRPDHAARQGPARADRVAAAHRQDRDAAEHRACARGQSPRSLSDRAADRRAARGSHRHGPLGQGRGRQLDLRRAGDSAMSRSPRW